MSYAIDLNPRQSARSIEQAIRQQAEVTVEPRAWDHHRYLLCRLELPGNPLELDLIPVLSMAVLGQVDPGNGICETHPISTDDLRDLTGTYVDAVISLGQQRYMFSSDMLRAMPPHSPGDHPSVHVTRPAGLQVAQRRRFRRICLSHSAQVELGWHRPEEPPMGGVAWLCNVSGDGMACRTEERIAENMWIGEELDIEFTLAPGDTERFHLQGVLCNKTPTGSLGKAILGIQFLADEAHAASAGTARLLRQRLVERATQLADMRKGVDS